MIGELTGQVSHLGEREAILSVGGVGFKVYVSSPTLSILARTSEVPVRLFTHLSVREDALELYGFLEPLERDLFLLLISVSGIGPKSALAILSLAPAQTLRQAIAAGEIEYLTRVSGIGQKSAGKIILELKDKLASLSSGDHAYLAGEADALEALRALGYSLREARQALQAIPSDITDTAERIKLALKALNSSR